SAKRCNRASNGYSIEFRPYEARRVADFANPLAKSRKLRDGPERWVGSSLTHMTTNQPALERKAIEWLRENFGMLKNALLRMDTTSLSLAVYCPVTMIRERIRL